MYTIINFCMNVYSRKAGKCFPFFFHHFLNLCVRLGFWEPPESKKGKGKSYYEVYEKVTESCS